jgi:hypothetical protein
VRRLSSCRCRRSDVNQDQLPDIVPAPQIGGMGRSRTTIVNELAVRPELVRRAVARHQGWIEKQLGVSLSDAVIFETDLDLAQIGIELFLAISSAERPRSSAARRLRPFVLTASTPPDFPALCGISKAQRTGDLLAVSGMRTRSQRSAISWEDCLIALHIRRDNSEFPAIALNFAYHSGLGSDYESSTHVIVVHPETRLHDLRGFANQRGFQIVDEYTDHEISVPKLGVLRWRVTSAILLLVDMTTTSYGVSVIIEASWLFGLFSGLIIFVTVAVAAGVIDMSSTLWRVFRDTSKVGRTPTGGRMIHSGEV